MDDIAIPGVQLPPTHSHSSPWVPGRIPTELGQLTALDWLDLSGNQLTGACDQNSLDSDW